jgi:hypothetical protein
MPNRRPGSGRGPSKRQQWERRPEDSAGPPARTRVSTLAQWPTLGPRQTHFSPPIPTPSPAFTCRTPGDSGHRARLARTWPRPTESARNLRPRTSPSSHRTSISRAPSPPTGRLAWCARRHGQSDAGRPRVLKGHRRPLAGRVPGHADDCHRHRPTVRSSVPAPGVRHGSGRYAHRRHVAPHSRRGTGRYYVCHVPLCVEPHSQRPE